MPPAVVGFSGRKAGTAGTAGAASLLLMSRSGAQAPAAAKHCPLLQSHAGHHDGQDQGQMRRLHRVRAMLKSMLEQVALRFACQGVMA